MGGGALKFEFCDWSLESYLSEIDSLDDKLVNDVASSDFDVPSTKQQPREDRSKGPKESYRSTGAFVMRVWEDYVDYSEDDDDNYGDADGGGGEESGRRFYCDEVYLSDDDSGHDSSVDKVALEEEGAFHDLTRDFQLRVLQLVRSKLLALKSDLLNETERFACSLDRIERHRESLIERERKIDLRYQRTIAEALDNHITSRVQRDDHDHVSQPEQTRTRYEMAREKSNRMKDPKQEIPIICASENALESEKRRMQIYEEVCARNNSLKASANNDRYIRRHELNIDRLVRTISATFENVRTRAEALVKLMKNPACCPQSISIQFFAKKILSSCANKWGLNSIFATTHVAVLVTSMVPQAMDILIAELNRACIYTVPKHINYLEEAFDSEECYFKVIGYKEEDDIDDYLERLSCYMKLYGALVQTEVRGFVNHHGLKEAWAWLARFLNKIPANLYTAVALHSFLEVAGFALHRRYRNQVEKIMNIVGRHFLNAKLLQDGSEEPWISTKLNKVRVSLRHYIDSRQFEKEPEGWRLRDHLESQVFVV